MKIVTFKWEPPGSYRSKFTGEHVNRLYHMIKEHYPHDFELICITDNPKGIDKPVRTYPLWNSFSDFPHPQGGSRGPSCYRRLPMYDGDFAYEIVGADRFVMIDMDVIFTADPTSAFHREEDFVIWGGTNATNPYNGSMTLMNVGCRDFVLHEFEANPELCINNAKQAGHFGSDQAWISYRLGKGEALFTKKDGVYSFRNDFQLPRKQELPNNASIVFFHGHVDPWDRQAQEFAWVRKHWTI